MPGQKDYTPQDLEDSLKRAFVDRKFESILVDGHTARNEFLRDSLTYGLDQGWLKKKRDITEPQYTAMEYILTDEGKSHFGISSE